VCLHASIHGQQQPGPSVGVLPIAHGGSSATVRCGTRSLSISTCARLDVSQAAALPACLADTHSTADQCSFWVRVSLVCVCCCLPASSACLPAWWCYEQRQCGGCCARCGAGGVCTHHMCFCVPAMRLAEATPGRCKQAHMHLSVALCCCLAGLLAWCRCVFLLCPWHAACAGVDRVESVPAGQHSNTGLVLWCIQPTSRAPGRTL
jgi:hypothetical protein